MSLSRHFTKLPHATGSRDMEMEGGSSGSGASGSASGSDGDESIDVSAELTNMTLAGRNGSPSTIRKASSSILSATAASAAASAGRHVDESIDDTESKVQYRASSPPSTAEDENTTTEEDTTSASPKQLPKKSRDRKTNNKTRPPVGSKPMKRSPSVEETSVKYFTATKLRLVLQHLSIAYILITILRSSIALWTGIYITARNFAWVPFSLEAMMGLLCASLSAGIFGESASRSKVATFFTVLWMTIISFAINVALFVFLSGLFGSAFFEDEPGSPLNVNWAWLYRLMIFYFVLTIFIFFLQFLISILMVVHTVLWARGDFAEEPTTPPMTGQSCRSFIFSATFWKRAFKNNYFLWGLRVVILLLLALFFSLFIAGIAAGVQTLTMSGFCPPSNPLCYRGCDPIDPTECIYPFPSTHFMRKDDATPTGWRMNLDRRSLPQLRAGGYLEPTYYNELDGWSTIGPLLFNLADPNVNISDFTSHTNIGASILSLSSNVLIINNATGALVPHWVEIDAVDYANNPSIIIQPAAPLEWSTRYIVCVRRIRNNATGLAIDPTPAMAQLLSPTLPEPSTLEQVGITAQRWSYYQRNILPFLYSRGVAVDDIQLAWDFVTASRQNTLGRAEFMRDDMYARHVESPLNYKINSIVQGDCTTADANRTAGRTVYGEVYAPMYLTATSRLAMLPRGLDGRRLDRFNTSGLHTSKFILIIPCSLINNPSPARALIQYGHGLFGSRSEVRTRWLSQAANRFNWIVFANDWFGMARFDVLGMARVLLGDPVSFVGLPESSLQGFVDKAATLRVILDRIIPNEPSIFRVGNVSLVDPRPGQPGSATALAYYGISQGGILGGSYVAFSRDHVRGVFGVPGSPYALLLGRSHDFDAYKTLFQLNMYTWRHIRIAITMMGQIWDAAESAGWLTSFNQRRAPGMRQKQALIQSAIGDAQVTTLGAQIMARAYGAFAVRNATRPIWGVPEARSPLAVNVSAIVEWQYFDVPAEPIESIPPLKRTDTHECPRRELDGQLQIRDFIELGQVVNYCGGGSCTRPSCPPR